MTADIKSYPAYKDSGVPWLGRLPEHWQVLRLGTLGVFSASGIDKKTVEGERLVNMVNYLDVYNNSTHELRSDREYMVVSCPDGKRKAHAVRFGDIFFTPSSETADDIGWSAVAMTDLPNTVYSYHILRFRLHHDVDMGFRKYWCNNTAVLQQFTSACKGTTRQILTRGDFRNILVPVPPLDEQSDIARYLDHADRKVRHVIRARQQLIKLLTEQKRAIINRAVTRGLDPNVPLKPSGVPWLGDVPEHWTLKRFKFLTRIASGQVDPREPKNRGRILIAPNHIESGTGRITHFETAQEQGADSGKYEVHQGQIIYSKIRPNLCKAAIAPMDCLCSADMYPIGVRETELRTAYVLRLLLSAPFTKYAVDCSLRVAMPKVNREALGECPLWYPNLEEQDAILQFLERATSPLDVAIGAARREIDLLREYRTRLIADVVTGKLDVRDAVVPDDETDVLPEELENIDESEATDQTEDVTETDSDSEESA